MNIFKPSRLYIKQCSHCELRYFGKTISQDIEKYRGSGSKWCNHLDKYNAKALHIWNSEWYYDQEKIKLDALEFSKNNNIVEDADWANLIEEDGINCISGFKPMFGDLNPSKRKEVREKISAALTGKKASKEAIRKNSEYRKGKTKENYEPIARMAKTISEKYTGLTKENSDMRINQGKSLSLTMMGKTKETCPRLAAASLTLKESARKIKKNDRKLIAEMKDSGMSFEDILHHFVDLKVNLKLIKAAYKDYHEIDKLNGV